MARSRSRNRRMTAGQDLSWPGFVDALSTLLLVIIFLLSIFMLAQFFLGQALSGQNEVMRRLHMEISDLSSQLSLKQKESDDLRVTLTELSASLQQANIDRDSMSSRINDLEGQVSDQYGAKRSKSALSDLEEARLSLKNEQKLSSAAHQKINLLNQQLSAIQQQLSALKIALEASEQKDKDQKIAIVNLSKRLNSALARKVQELHEFRSEFFGKLKKTLSKRADIRIKGDRFIFQSEVLFTSGSATLGKLGRAEMRQLAKALKEISTEIPKDIKWILRVDGHTDALPIRTAEFPSNWDLSTKRALSVVKYLISQGIPAENLAAAGFGQYQPIDKGKGTAANKRNRRIEMRLTPQ